MLETSAGIILPQADEQWSENFIDSSPHENILRTKARRPLSNAMLFYED
jgi:hypothetical protein